MQKNKNRFFRLRKTSTVFFGLMFSVLMLQAQNIKVSGVIVDEKNETAIGASVKVSGTKIAVITDFNGEFKLECPTGSTLEISYIGYSAQKVKAQQKLKVQLSQSSVTLQETVVVGIGYGSVRKADLTGAITSVSAKDLKQGVVTSAEQLLQGKVAGLSVVQGSGDPAAGASMKLRGGTSLSAGNSPLVVVDGIPGVDMNSVQPSEIISIDVLKDASAAAIYGSRGANGVIIITTNRSAGTTEVKSMSYSGYVGVSNVAKHMDILSANQWRDYVRTNNVLNAVDYGANTDWQKSLERTAISQQHNLFFSNVNSNSGFRASLSYQNNEGVLQRSSLNRLAGSISAHQYGLNKKLKLEAGINASTDNWTPIDLSIIERECNLNPTVPIYTQSGTYTAISGTNTENPVEINNDRFRDDSRHRLLGFAKAEIEFFKGLKGVVNGSYEYNSYQTRSYLPSYAVMTGASLSGQGQRTLGDNSSFQLESYLTEDLKFENKTKLNIMAGYSYLESQYEGFGAIRSGFDTDAFLYNNLGAGFDYTSGDVYSYKGISHLVSFYGRLNFNYLGRYLFTGTLREDGSSRFGANNKWGLFPSASFGWRASDEAFLKDCSGWLNNLKVRLGYGVTGNQDGIGDYKSLQLLSATGASYYDPIDNKWKKAYSPVQNANPDLKWESTAQTNLGIDFGFLGKISGTLEFYLKQTNDLLWTYPVPQPPYLVNTMLLNLGSLSNKGVELTLNASIVKSKDFSFDATITAAYNDQRIDKLTNNLFGSASDLKTGSMTGIRGMTGTYTQVIKEGYPAGAFWGPKCLGINSDGEYILNKDANGNVINEYLGSAQPKFNLGFAMNFAYRDFDLNIGTYGMFGQKVLNATAMSMADPTRLPSQNVTDAFLKTGITSDPTFSSYWIENGDFFRLQSLTIGYNLPKNLRLGLEKFRVYLTGENLFVLTAYSGTDPEVGNSGLDSPGIDRFNYYPRPRTFSFGLNISF
ncbi:MAG: TonB-dependent receptor [Paludibacter sp.]|jgi:TonB-dependent starch-binding outer membrane protein SusC